MSWSDIKNLLESSTGLAEDALHVYAGVLIQIAAAAVTRRRLSSPVPWLVVLVLAVLNEISDTYLDRRPEEWELSAAKHDLWNTMLLPTVLLLTARFVPQLFAGPRSSGRSRKGRR